MLEALFGDRTVKEPICLIKDHTEFSFITKELDSIRDRYEEEMDRMVEQRDKEHKLAWSKVGEVLKAKGLSDYSEDVNLFIRDGVLFKETKVVGEDS